MENRRSIKGDKNYCRVRRCPGCGIPFRRMAGRTAQGNRGFTRAAQSQDRLRSSLPESRGSMPDLGDKDHAFEWLNTAYQEHDVWLIALRTDPRFDSLRSDPRYAELVRKIGFPQ